MAETAVLEGENLSVSFGKAPVLEDLSLSLAPQTITVIVGPNGSGKSTLLRTFARLQKPSAGEVLLNGTALQRQRTRHIAQHLAVLPQGLVAPVDLTVRDLVARGRMPHQTPLQQWRTEDAEIVVDVLAQTGLETLADRRVASLSGGQQQRVWLAMILAQQTDILLLDEPTTFLDLPHQIELLQFIRRLRDDNGKTVAMVLHDINLAARFADRLVAIKAGQICADGSPDAVVTPEVMQEVFALTCQVIRDPIHGKPFVIPA